MLNIFGPSMKDSYKILGLALLLSFIAMYSITYTNLDSIDNLTLSLTRFYRTTLMTCAMAIIMILVMKNMFPNKKANTVIWIVALVIFITALFLLRTQTFVGDEAYMRAMIPHHSSAILKSEQASLNDPQVQELARQIIVSQKEEIAIMKSLLEGEDVSDRLYNRTG